MFGVLTIAHKKLKHHNLDWDDQQYLRLHWTAQILLQITVLVPPLPVLGAILINS